MNLNVDVLSLSPPSIPLRATVFGLSLTAYANCLTERPVNLEIPLTVPQGKVKKS